MHPRWLVGCGTVVTLGHKVQFSFAALQPFPFTTRWGCKHEFRPAVKKLLPLREGISMSLAHSGTSFCCCYLDHAYWQDAVIHK